MILLVDVGNSRIKWSTLAEGRLAPGQSAAWRQDRLESLLGAQWARQPPPAAIWVANVAGPEVAQRLEAWIVTRFGHRPRYVSSVAELGGVTNSYVDPAQLGVDRLLAMVAARRSYSRAVCVVDCGTAVTVDLLDAQGTFRGGVIAPGSGLMRRALSRDTYALPPTQIAATSACARSTGEGIAAGCLLALLAFIERVYREFAQVLGEKPACVVSGGEAPLVLPTLSIPCDHDPDLVLRGLAFVAETMSA
ncbi:MAG: type III pantothenate kinase [Chromatiales bacterium]